MPPEKGTIQTVTITSIREETPGVKTITITPQDGNEIDYIAGQFITLVFTHHGKEERRSFSLSSAPALNEPLSFTVKRVDNGAYSRLLTDRAKLGDTLYTTGAAGFFVLPANIAVYEQVFFFAAGIGITPILPLIKTLLHTHPAIQAALVYSNRTKEETVFLAELMSLEKTFPGRFRIVFLYSTAFDLIRARLSKSLVRTLLNELALTSNSKMLFFVCGPFSYMRMVIYALGEAGINEQQIRKENFNTSDKVVSLLVPPDKETHTVTLHQNNVIRTLSVTYPDTILQAAKKQGISLPYSCEVGRCGSCAAICTSGKVWHSYNEVLMDIELQRGSILTCTGHPLFGDVEITV